VPVARAPVVLEDALLEERLLARVARHAGYASAVAKSRAARRTPSASASTSDSSL